MAWRLAQQGMSVIAIDKALPGFGASVANPGSLAIQNKPLRLSRLAAMAVEEWATFNEETGFDVGYKRIGGLRLAQTEADVEKLAETAAAQSAVGIEISHLRGQEMRELGPYLGPTVLAANYVARDGYSNSLKATPAVVRAAVRAGARFVSRTTVTAIRDEGSQVTVETSDGSYRAAKVVVSASGGATELLRPFGYELPMDRRVMQVYVTERLPRIIPHMITHMAGDLTLKQSSEGSILIGGGWPARLDGQNEPTPIVPSLQGNAKRAVETIPILSGLSIIRCWGGVDHQPVGWMPRLGPLPSSDRVWLLTACTGGYTLSLLLARLTAAWMKTGICPMEIQEFAARPLTTAKGAVS